MGTGFIGVAFSFRPRCLRRNREVADTRWRPTCRETPYMARGWWCGDGA
jgi:hypothetical protein